MYYQLLKISAPIDFPQPIKMKPSFFKKLVVPAIVVPLPATGKSDIGSSPGEVGAVRLKKSAVEYCLANYGSIVVPKTEGRCTRLTIKTFCRKNLPIFKPRN